MATQKDLRDSAQRKLEGAERLLGGKSPLPSESAYLATVATECALKTLLMNKHSIRDTKEIEEGHQLEPCFGGKGGHSFDRLLVHLKDRQLPSLSGDLRARVTNPVRPYSLRYGEEKLEVAEAQAEIEWARDAVLKTKEFQ